MLRFVFVLLLAFVFGAAEAQPRVGTATITARLTHDGLHAEVHLSRAVTEFAFARADVVREGDIDVLTPGLVLDGDSISSARRFRRFEVLIRPMSQERDAKYPAFFRAGLGGVLYAPALTGDTSQWRTRLRIVTAPGQVLAPASGPNEHGSVFVGPADHVHTAEGALIVAPPDAPRELYDAAASELRAAMQFYTRTLNAPLPTTPVLVLAHGGEGQGQVGDVTPGPFVSMRFYGGAWGAPDENTRAMLSRFVSHEAFHFWNGSLTQHAEGTPTWLHEGGADYAALLSARDTGALDDTGVAAALGDALTRCRDALRQRGDVSMNSIGFLPQQIRYPCGIVIQWAADLSVKRTNTQGVLGVWASMIATAQARENRSYTLADFTEAPGMGEAGSVIALLTEQSGAERWTTLTETLRGLGAEISSAPTDNTRRMALLFHVLPQNCPGAESFGFYTENNRIRLQEEAACGALSNVVVLSIEGGDAFAPSAETYTRAQAACAAQRPVAFLLEGGQRVDATCERPLADAPHAFLVSRWR